MIFVTGGSGQLARSIGALGAGRDIRVVGRPAFDFDQPDSIATVLRAAAPSLVINAAAWTAVDAAETNVAAATRANRDGPETLAQACAEAGIPLIHVSTDYVFDGFKGTPYVETDATSPTGVYGATKRAGEVAVLAACSRAIVLRTSWVYADAGKNFVLTMLNAARKTNTLRVVADQHGCPTAAPALAEAILKLSDRLANGWSTEYGGIYHAAGGGATTWHGLATAVFAEAARHGVEPPTIVPITTADWPTPARRPPDSRLNCEKLARVFNISLPDWRDSLTNVMATFYSRDRSAPFSSNAV